MDSKLKNYDEFPAMMEVKDLERIFPLSRAGIYSLINSEGFPIIRIGKRIIIPKDRLLGWIEKNISSSAGI